MAIGPRLELRQAQTLKLTPQLMQSIKLLQLSHLELSTFVESELLHNPLLERGDPDGDNAVDNDQGDNEAQPAASETQDIVSRSEQMESAVSLAGEMDTDASNLFPEQVGQDSVSQSTTSWQESRGQSVGPEKAEIDQYVSSQKSLGDHLIEQVQLILRHPGDLLIASAIIENLNEAGYLDTELDNIAEQLGTELGHVEAVLEAIQGCDPIGIFARSVPECLAIQLREKDRLDPMMQSLLDNIDLVAAHKFKELMALIRCDQDDLKDMLTEIKRLNPRPGASFEGSAIQSVVPDVHIRPANGGGWQIELNNEVLPNVLINRTYYAEISAKAKKGEEKSYLQECMQTANWLTKSLDQRAQTILKVTSEIARLQDGFLVHGVSHLKPMTLKMVAEAVDMHESTISRVTANKYVSTPRGLFELRYFFTSAISSSTNGDDDHSAEAVRHEIKQLIDAEDPKKILSDDKIAAILNEKHQMGVARRTVAKYREAMGIPSSVLRRRQKRELLS
ncbi:RNA polymerase factor sigma-54 [Maritalea porphyrae]|uniref:RNA polymerase sigma-54 factor n=1 Tax=Maritalea porphyrae TaxID=880732 RepID=A0ABQ5UTA6_9HYPH|nr:RNA polymerase factor sigma-54 [Maritalea porphyrae]GLQ17197.1 RNA polymerase sigma-54 factor [Maritalea porphyrae]